MFKQNRYKIESERMRVTETKHRSTSSGFGGEEPRNCSENAYCTSDVHDIEVDDGPRTTLKIAAKESPVVNLRPEIYVMALTTWWESF